MSVPIGGLIAEAVSTTGDTISGDLVITGKLDVLGTTAKTGEQTETVSDNKTLDAGDSGVVQVVTVDAKTITLPATAIGLSYTIRNGGANGAVAVTISPNSNDMIVGNGFTGANDKDVVNTKATAKKGDYIKLIGDGTTGVGWNVVEVVGTWAREE